MRTPINGIRNRPVLSFFVLTYVYSWLLWAPTLMIPMEVGPDGSDTLIWIGVGFMYLGGFGPLVAGAIVVTFGGGNLRTWAGQIVTWRVDARWWLAALGVPMVAVIAVSGLYIAFGGPYDFGALTAPILLYIPLLLFAVVFSGGLNEEPGWRGLAQPLLQERYSALTASLVVGVVFAVWHLPLFFAPVAPHSDFPLLNSILYFPTVVVWSVLLGWLYNNSAGVLLAMFFHASLNSTGGLIPIDPEGIIIEGAIQEGYLGLISGLNLGVYFLIALVVVAVFGRTRLTRGDMLTGEVAGFERHSE